MQELLIKFICWSSLVPFGYILLVCILAEMSLGRPKIKNGILRVNKKSFVIDSVYKCNFLEKNSKKEYPSNICKLFWGIFWGIPRFCCGFVFVIVVSVFTGIFGFILDFREDADRFTHPYQTYEKRDELGQFVGEKKFIAPWKFILGFVIWYQFAQQPDRTFGVIAKTPEVIAELFSMAITGLFIPVLYLGAICLVIYLIYFIIKKTFTATGEFLKARNKKICIDVDLV
ncbi:MAG: hypothetical protein PHX25_00510 [Candidatus Pacebacteria bacterium]|nr:hypothetical protein [Candidatus Paceibacterota bacterium]